MSNLRQIQAKKTRRGERRVKVMVANHQGEATMQRIDPACTLAETTIHCAQRGFKGTIACWIT